MKSDIKYEWAEMGCNSKCLSGTKETGTFCSLKVFPITTRHFSGLQFTIKMHYITSFSFNNTTSLQSLLPRTTDTQWRYESKISEKLGRYGRQNILWLYLKIWDWDWIFGRVVKVISCLGIHSLWFQGFNVLGNKCLVGQKVKKMLDNI